jgi:uncharacterized membrane protein
MKKILGIQGWVYLVLGLWPIFHMSSFLAVTGEKADLWLVRTVGGLIAISGFAFIMESRKKWISTGVQIIAVGEALFLLAIDVLYVGLQVIPKVYLLDALLETALFITWVAVLLKTDWGKISDYSPRETDPILF